MFQHVTTYPPLRQSASHDTPKSHEIYILPQPICRQYFTNSPSRKYQQPKEIAETPGWGYPIKCAHPQMVYPVTEYWPRGSPSMKLRELFLAVVFITFAIVLPSCACTSVDDPTKSATSVVTLH